MRLDLSSTRCALLASLGLLHACGARSEAGDPPPQGGSPSPNTTSPSGPHPSGPSPTDPSPADSLIADPVPNEPLPAPMLTPPGGACSDFTLAPHQECNDGFIERTTSSQCPSILPRGGEVVASGLAATNPGGYSCTSDADCTEFPTTWCELYTVQIIGSGCARGCVTDDECDPGYACECGSPAGRCVAAGCRSSDECGADSVCARYEFDDGCGPHIGYACTTAHDECWSSADCGGAPCGVNWVSGDTNHRQCVDWGCVVGRPWLIGGGARLAAIERRVDWTGDVLRADNQEALVRSRSLTALQRQTLAERWLQLGLMEHASVAAFARFSLQLLALGAPAGLSARCGTAMRDEIRHAQLMFALAAEFGCERVGPGPLDVTGALDALTLRDVILATFAEGCIGETTAFVEARHGAQTTTRPAIARLLAQVATDERRHAQLAWSFVGWGLGRLDVGSRLALADELRSVIQARANHLSNQLGASPEQPWLAEFGLLDLAEQPRLQLDVLRQVVGPCLETLLASSFESRGEHITTTATAA